MKRSPQPKETLRRPVELRELANRLRVLAHYVMSDAPERAPVIEELSRLLEEASEWPAGE